MRLRAISGVVLLLILGIALGNKVCKVEEVCGSSSCHGDICTDDYVCKNVCSCESDNGKPEVHKEKYCTFQKEADKCKGRHGLFYNVCGPSRCWTSPNGLKACTKDLRCSQICVIGTKKKDPNYSYTLID
eukprot:TRINITY_DN1112_c0_g1_i4.p1 TRINITY_DN1112_c0_g1~~TRINITY_DN1112_c0_g1_i4.p1  ORF type:complete len:130 (+),score=2.28 TRINITY_DN1112_c0_g1_i4:134-523(+)